MSTISQRRQEWERQVALAQAARPSRLRQAWQQLSGNNLALVGFVIVLLYCLAAVVGPVLAPNYATQVLNDARLPPLTPGHPLGTDDLGRDMLSRLVLGIRISIAVGLGTTAISLLVGTVAGMIMGYYRGWVDTFVNGFVEMVWGFPLILIAVLMVGALGPGLVGVVLAVGLINWAGFARIIRGEVLVLREREFIASARALGTGNTAIMVKHLLPNVIGPALVMGSYYVAVAIIVEAGLSFIGMGAQEPLPSLGKMVADGRGYMLVDHWISTVPGLAIVLLVLGLNVLGDGLRDIFDPRLRER